MCVRNRVRALEADLEQGRTALILGDLCLVRRRLAQPPFEFLDATFGSFASRRLFGQAPLGGIGARLGRSAHRFRFHVVRENLARSGIAEYGAARSRGTSKPSGNLADMVRTRVNPFVPGRGALPPYLAGREAEKRTLMEVRPPLPVPSGPSGWEARLPELRPRTRKTR